MDGPKHVPGKKLDQLVEGDPVRQVASEHQLENATASGNKFALLESLLLEGKLSRAPYAGPQALRTEGQLSTGELVGEALAGGRTAGTQAAQAMTPGEKGDLIRRVLDERPGLSVKELTAACQMLDIDPKQFVDRMVELKTEKLQGAIEQAAQAKSASNIILIFSYQSREDTEIVLQQYKEATGKTVFQSVAALLKSPLQKFEFDLSLFGRAESPREDLERMQAILQFEKSERAKNGMFFVRPDHVHLNSAEEKLRMAAAYLAKDDLIDEDAHDGFQSFLKGAAGDIEQYGTTVSSYDKDPQAYIALIVAALCVIGLLYIGYSSSAPVAASAVVIMSVLAWHRSAFMVSSRHAAIIERLSSRYLTESQKRAFARSFVKKARIT